MQDRNGRPTLLDATGRIPSARPTLAEAHAPEQGLARDAWAAEQALAEARDPADVARAWAAARDAWAAWRKVARPNRHGPAVHAARGPSGSTLPTYPGWHIRPWRASDEPGTIKERGKIGERAC